MWLDNDMFNTETAKVARFTRTLNEVPQITFSNGIHNDANLLPEGMNTVAQAIAQGWVKTSDGRWIK